MKKVQILFIGFLLLFILKPSVSVAKSRGKTPAKGKGGGGLGPGALGANRRVQLQKASAVTGTFQVNSMAADSVLKVIQSKPNLYLGGGMRSSNANSVQIDAGLLYEPTLFPPDYTKPAQKVTGWTGILYVHGGEKLNSKTNLTTEWYVDRSSLGSPTIEFIINDDGTASCRISGVPLMQTSSTPFPLIKKGKSKGRYSASTLKQMFVKRVSAISQYKSGHGLKKVGSAFLDDSYLDSTFSGGQVAIAALDKSGKLKQHYDSWKKFDKSQTGYDPGVQDGQGNWIIDFGGKAQRSSTGKDGVDPDRYHDEEVIIKLMKGKGKIKGNKPKKGI